MEMVNLKKVYIKKRKKKKLSLQYLGNIHHDDIWDNFYLMRNLTFTL